MTFRLTQRRLELLSALDDLGGEYRQIAGRVRADLSRMLRWDVTTTRRVIGDLATAELVAVSGTGGRIDRILLTPEGVRTVASRAGRAKDVRRYLIGDDRDLSAERIAMRAETIAARVVEWAQQADLDAGVDQVRLQWNAAMHADITRRHPTPDELRTEFAQCCENFDAIVAAASSTDPIGVEAIETALLSALEVRTLLISMYLDVTDPT